MKNLYLFIGTALIATLIFNSCDKSFKEVTIGNQVWMQENLDVDKFRNGDLIPYAESILEWRNAEREGTPAWCYYNNNPDSGKHYGKLYNWYAVNDARGLAPEGWKIPTDDDWSNLVDFLGGAPKAGDKIKYTNYWASWDGVNGKISGNGTNESGFSALPGGCYVRSNDWVFDYAGYYGFWWSSSESSKNFAYCRALYNNHKSIYRKSERIGYKSNGFSVRCLRE